MKDRKDFNRHRRYPGFRPRFHPWHSPLPWHMLMGMTAWKKKSNYFSRKIRKWRMNFPFAEFEDTEEEFLLKLEVPGVEKDKISAKASEGALTVEVEGEPYYYPLVIYYDPKQ